MAARAPSPESEDRMLCNAIKTILLNHLKTGPDADMEVINLESLQLSDAEFFRFVDAMRKRRIRKLIISRNPAITSAGIQALVNALPSMQLLETIEAADLAIDAEAHMLIEWMAQNPLSRLQRIVLASDLNAPGALRASRQPPASLSAESESGHVSVGE